MELCTGMSLYHHIKKLPDQRLPEETCKVISKRLILGVSYLYARQRLRAPRFEVGQFTDGWMWKQNMLKSLILSFYSSRLNLNKLQYFLIGL